MTAPRKPEPLTEEELASLVLDYCDGLEQSALDGMTRLFATLDLARERLAEVERERDEARNVCEQLSARTEAAELGEKVLTVERDALRAEVEAWRIVYHSWLAAGGPVLPPSVAEAYNKARRLRAQNKGGQRAGHSSECALGRGEKECDCGEGLSPSDHEGGQRG
jgi:hypothetical protein